MLGNTISHYKILEKIGQGFTPLLLLAIYTLVFSEVFRVRWGVTREESRIAPRLMPFAGLLPYQLFSYGGFVGFIQRKRTFGNVI
ncbi:hypothetical protein MYX82_10260 [Acidobacteria bacterium AH-259-D05]|nr:hypothetical protein [Acidobacteria bacterium AH-259-D05]